MLENQTSEDGKTANILNVVHMTYVYVIYATQWTKRHWYAGASICIFIRNPAQIWNYAMEYKYFRSFTNKDKPAGEWYRSIKLHKNWSWNWSFWINYGTELYVSLLTNTGQKAVGRSSPQQQRTRQPDIQTIFSHFTSNQVLSLIRTPPVATQG